MDCAGQFCVLSGRSSTSLYSVMMCIYRYKFVSVASRKLHISKYKTSLSYLITSSKLQTFNYLPSFVIAELSVVQVVWHSCRWALPLLWQHHQQGACETDFIPSLLTPGYYNPNGLSILSFTTCVSSLLNL